MSRNNFSVTILMKAFFGDYRAQARLFINENIRTVSDLENKITRIFNIRNFYLVSHSRLLPSCEDIRLLDNGDTVRVVPNNSQSEVLLLDHEFYVMDAEGNTSKKKKYSKDVSPVKGKKCKKKKKEAQADDVSQNNLFTIYEENASDLRTENNTQKSCEVPQLLDMELCDVDDTEKTPKKKKKRQNTEDDCPVKEKKCKRKRNKISSYKDECSRMQKYESDGKIYSTANSSIIKRDKINRKSTKKLESGILFTSTPSAHKDVSEIFYFGKKVDASNMEEKPQQNKKKQFHTINISNKENKQTEKYNEGVTDNSNSKAIIKEKVCNIERSNDFSQKNSSEDEKVFEKSSSLAPNVKTNEIVDYSCYPSEKKGVTDRKSNRMPHDNSSSSSESEPEYNNLIKFKPQKEERRKIINNTSSSSSNSSDEGKEEHSSRNKKVSWSTLPLQKKTNLVKIEKISVEPTELDISKFIFRKCDIGSVPVPKSNSMEVENQNATIQSNDVIVGEVDKSRNISKLSDKNTEYSLMFNIMTVNNVDASIKSSDVSGELDKSHNTSKLSDKNTEYSLVSGCEKISQPTSCENQEPFKEASYFTKTVNGDISVYEEKEKSIEAMKKNDEINNVSKREMVMNDWKKSISEKLSCDNTTPESKLLKPPSGKANNENSSKVMKLNSNSSKIKRKCYMKQFSGVNYYLKLMNKIDWDTSKSISTVKADHSDSEIDKVETKKSEPIKEISEDNAEEVKNTEVVSAEFENDEAKAMKIDNTLLESASSICVSTDETDFITRRKRKRSRKKTRAATPIPKRNWPTVRTLPVVLGSPKVHIRFDEGDKNFASKMTNTSPAQPAHCENECLDGTNKQEIVVLQNIILGPNAELEKNLVNLPNICKSTSTQNESIIKIGEPEASVMCLSSDYSTNNLDESRNDHGIQCTKNSSHHNGNCGLDESKKNGGLLVTSGDVDHAQSLEAAKAKFLEELKHMTSESVPENMNTS